MIVVERDIKTIHFKSPSQPWGQTAWQGQAKQYGHTNIILTFEGDNKEEMTLTVHGIIHFPIKFKKSLHKFYTRVWKKSVKEFTGEILFETQDGILLLGGQVLLQRHRDQLESMIRSGQL